MSERGGLREAGEATWRRCAESREAFEEYVAAERASWRRRWEQMQERAERAERALREMAEAARAAMPTCDTGAGAPCEKLATHSETWQYEPTCYRCAEHAGNIPVDAELSRLAAALARYDGRGQG